MIAFRDRAIRQKLLITSLFSKSVVLLLASVAFITTDFLTSRSYLAKNISTLGEVIGFNVTSAIVFNDLTSANQTLASLSVRPSILSAGIYTSDGRLFAHWERDPQANFSSPP